jgi:pimeloyl-ACP methyl ester carboxylesterase
MPARFLEAQPVMSRLRRTLLALSGALLLAAGAACTGGEPGPGPSESAQPSTSATPTLPPVGVDCQELADQGKTLRLQNSSRLEIAAVDLGSGHKGVVLAHQSDASMCQWASYATLLAQQGYRVVVFDFAGFGTSSPTEMKTYLDDIRTVVNYLRQDGVERVVVVGASMGAAMSVAAATAAIDVDGVVAVSPPRSFDGVYAERAAPQLRTPTLIIAGDDDGDYEVYAREIFEATPAELGELLVVPAPQHGVELVGAQTGAGAQVRAAIGDFLARQLTPPPTTSPPR